jgi:hypothetical protein
MTSKSMSYDHPAYLTPYIFAGNSVAGASGVTQKFAAFTAMKIKQVVHAPVLALITTAAGSQPLLYTQSGTTTSTTTLTILTSASYAAVVDDISDVTLAQGDRFWYTHGTDAQVSQAVAIECVVIPGANISA